MKHNTTQHRLLILVTVVIYVALIGTGYLERQKFTDWWKLRDYTPASAVTLLATQDTMTNYARHLLYVNHPMVTTGTAFTNECPSGAEKTVVLGCYKAGDDGIWVYKVTDTSLNGVEQVTIAHEMLHAAYARLSSHQRTYVDGLLENYYEHGLTDKRIVQTITEYQQSEPSHVVNEMHSVFGTEVTQLPPALETYYKQYFVNRSVVTAFTAHYENQFTTLQQQVQNYDKQLKQLKITIQSNETTLQAQEAALSTQQTTMDSLKSAGDYVHYNDDVDAYNQDVKAYNTLLQTTKQQIAQYNSLIDIRNSIALTEDQLVQEISPQRLPGTK